MTRTYVVVLQRNPDPLEPMSLLSSWSDNVSQSQIGKRLYLVVVLKVPVVVLSRRPILILLKSVLTAHPYCLEKNIIFVNGAPRNICALPKMKRI